MSKKKTVFKSLELKKRNVIEINLNIYRKSWNETTRTASTRGKRDKRGK